MSGFVSRYQLNDAHKQIMLLEEDKRQMEAKYKQATKKKIPFWKNLFRRKK